MRTMPSDTLVTVPSLRASAASLTFSMRVLISSLISDGLSVVAISLVPLCQRRRRGFDIVLRVRGCRFVVGGSAIPMLRQLPTSNYQPNFYCANAACSRDSLPFSEPSITTSPASITAPPISDASIAVPSSTSRPKRFFNAALIVSSSPAGSSVAEVMVALTTRSASAFSSSYRPAISGSCASRRFSANRARKRENDSPAPSIDSSDTASAWLSCGLSSSDAARGSAATCAAKPSALDQPARPFSSCAMENAARAYGRARVRAWLIGSDLCRQLVEQRLVGVGVDLAPEQLLGAAHGQDRDLL